MEMIEASELIQVPLTSIIPYEYNGRKHPQEQIDRIANSINEFGFNQPILLDEKNVILAGHGRFLAAQKLKLKTIPCIFQVNLSEVQKKAYRILDNKLAHDSEWEFDALGLDLSFLEDNDFDFEAYGLDDLKQMLDDLEPAGVAKEDGYEAMENIQTEIVQGDIICIGQHRLMCGDSTDAASVGALLVGVKPTLMVTDPPYGVEYDPSWREGADLGIGKRSKGKVTNDDRVDWSEAYSLIDAQVAYVWHGHAKCREVAESLEIAGYEIVVPIVWVKQHFALSRGDYHWQHEACFYVVKKGQKHNWQGARDQSTVWEIKNNNSFGNADKEETFGHGTQKPIECMARPIRNNSAKGDIICDPFLGSGTTMIAAEQLGRVCYGIEIDPGYCQMIIERMSKAYPGIEITKNGEPYKPSEL